MPHREIKDIIANRLVVTATAEMTVLEASRRMMTHHVGAIMVTEAGRLVGIFTERDAVFRVMAQGLDPRTTLLAQVMTADPQTIHPRKPLGHALHMMHEAGYRHVPVVENGRPVGMVSARDALGAEMLEFESELLQRDRIAACLG